mgnify:CR=1 FL=1
METLPFPLPTITSKRSSKMIDDLPVEMIFSQNSGSQVLDLVLEISPRDNPEGAKEIPKEPKVILSGKVDKRSPYWYYQKRNLVLTDEPKLKYYDAKTNKYKVILFPLATVSEVFLLQKERSAYFRQTKSTSRE